MTAARVLFVSLFALTFVAGCGFLDDNDTGTGTVDTGDPPDPSNSDFTIDLLYVVEPTESQRRVFEIATTRWRNVITNSLPSVRIDPKRIPRSCGGPIDAPVIDVTGVAITVDLSPIDGAGNVLGVAGPCSLRTSDDSPLLGTMQFDSADLDVIERQGALEIVILHEMGHVLGFGTLWDRAGLLQEPSVAPDGSPGADTHFSGERARAAFQNAFSGSFSGSIVPVENSGDEGSADGHWRENVMETELMTPSINGREPSVPMSAITIESLGDLPYYDVDSSVAESYTVRRNFAPVAVDDADNTMDFNCRLLKPQFEVDLDGNFYELINR